jgi:NitT/TauT family transport system permease protein
MRLRSGVNPLNWGWVRPVLMLSILLVGWDLAVRLLKIPPYLIPPPADVVVTLWKSWPTLLQAAVPTTLATVCGFLASAVVGVVAAIAITSSPTIESYVYPLLVFSQSIPKIAIAPLMVVWFGFGIVPKILVAFMLGVFPVVVSSVQGLKSVESDMLNLARAMEANRFQVFRMISLPHAAPAIFSGLKISITLCVVGAVVGEFVGSNNGIGYVLQRSIGNFDLPFMFAALVLLSLLGVVLFWIIDIIERLTIPWHASHRTDLIVSA